MMLRSIRDSIRRWCMAVFIGGLGLAIACQARATDDYWSWGWGDYGAGLLENVAPFDWSMINYGNVAQDQRTVDRCNAILELNPDHKFVIRFWPIMGLGKLPNNRYQATLWDYFYRPEVKEKIQANIRAQFDLLYKGLTRPEAIVGMTFLEELPGHFTSAPFKSDITEPFMPWAMAPFAEQIHAELGHPFDITQTEDALWWGKKYSQYLNEVHAFMRSLKPDAKIIYWQATYYNTLDRKDKQLFKGGVLPIHLKDLLKDGHCDGIFGYPNSEEVWQKQTLDMVAKYDCHFFSQVSTPGFMRLSTFDNTVDWAQAKYPGNLGTFVFFGRPGPGTHAWNVIPEFKGNTQIHMGDQQRWFLNKYQIGNDVVQRILQPRLFVSYDFSDKKVGDFVTLSAVLYNPRNKSWLGGNEDAVALQNVEMHLTSLPEGYALPAEANSPAKLNLGTLAGESVVEALWWLKKQPGDTVIDPTKLKIEIQAAGVPKQAWSGTELLQSRASNEHFIIRNSGDRWLTLTGGTPKSSLHLEIEPLLRDLSYPKLVLNGEEVVYKGVLEKGSKLLLYPGVQARLHRMPLLSEKTQRFNRTDDASVSIFDSKYLVFSTPALKVKADTVYTLEIAGHVSDDAILNVIAEFTGTVDGKVEKVSVGNFNKLKQTPETVSLKVPTPTFDVGSEIKAVVRFYRHKQIGKLHLQHVNLVSDEEREQDVSDKLDGYLTLRGNSIIRVGYADRDEVNFGQSELARFTIVDDSAVRTPVQESRKGGADF